MTVLVLIAAMDANRAIGVDNGLPWHLPDDLKRFRALTIGKTVLMGRKTAESLGRALPGRINLVLTRSGRIPFECMQAVASLAQALQACGNGDLMVIGGGEVYALTLPHAQRMHVMFEDDAKLVVGDLADECRFATHGGDSGHAVGRRPSGHFARHAHSRIELVGFLRGKQLHRPFG